METPAPKPSRVKKYFRRAFFALAVLITLGALFIAEEDWRGGHAWRSYKREMEAKGDSFDPARLIPPKVPDDQNLAMIPFFTKAEAIKLPDNVSLPRRPEWRYGLAADLTNWAQALGSPSADPVRAASTVLDALNKREPLLAELKTASQRPSCRFNIDYENWENNTNVQAATIEQFGQIKRFYRILSLRAEAELVSDQSNQALEDIGLMFRVNDSLRDEPLLISQLVAYAGIEILLQPLAQGLAEHRWSDAQLQAVRQRLQGTDLLAPMARAFRGERDLCANPFFNDLPASPDFAGMRMMPRGWVRLEQLNCDRAIQDMVLARIDVAARRIDPGVCQSYDLALQKLTSGSGLADALIHHRIFARMLFPEIGRAAVKTAETQTDVDEAIVACALERHRLAEGNYPETLDALVPRFATALPHDIITGQPLKYRRAENGKFVLYSLGWNEKDDGGTIATNKDGRQDRMRGDWVFEYPKGD